MIVTAGSVKTNFIVRNIENLGEFDKLIFRDYLNSLNENQITCKFNNDKNSLEAIDDFTIFSSDNKPYVTYHQRLSYTQAEDPCMLNGVALKVLAKGLSPSQQVFKSDNL